MTLHRQLILIVFGLFLIVFTGTFYISIQNVRSYLNNQLISHAQDTATSLGLSLSPHMKNKDIATMNSMIDAVFDRGDYREIEIIDVQGETMIKREIPVVINQVPDWFVRTIKITTPAGEALLMSGWSQAATIYVRSHPGYAYFELWQNAKQTFSWFLLTGFSIWLLGYITLKSLLKPLRHVERQAEAICSREYPIQEQLPWTRELRNVVLAMNKMVMRLKEMFQEQADLTDRLREEAYRDPVTGLGNRKYFEQQFETQVESAEELENGALFLIQIQGLQTTNDENGFEAGDQLLRQASKHIQTVFNPCGEYLAARLTGADFLVLVGGMIRPEAQQIGQKLSDQLAALTEEGLLTDECASHVGVLVFNSPLKPNELLAQADHALRSAQNKGANAVVTEVYEGQLAMSATDWRSLLDSALVSDRVGLVFQPVLDSNGDLLHEETLARIQDEEGNTYSAGVFIPMAVRNQMADQLDMTVVKHALQSCAEDRKNQTTAVNLSPAAICDPEFTQWLYQELVRVPQIAKHLIFEVSEFGVVRDVDSARTFADELHRLGSRFAIDHFGRGFSSFGFLQSIRVAYLKLDSSFTREIESNSEARFFLESLIRTAHSIDIPVIAEAVETESQKQALIKLSIDGVQGYLTGRPA